MRNVSALSLGLATIAVLASARFAHADTEITACGQQIASGAAFLSADLDCTGSASPYGVRFYGTGVVDLRGFTIRNAGVAISCEGNCNVSNGSLIGNLTSVAGLRVKLRNVTITGGNTAVSNLKGANLKNVTVAGVFEAVAGDRGTIRLDSVTIDGVGRNAARSINGTIVAVDTTITNVQRAGLMGTRVKLIRSSVAGSGTDPDCNTLTGGFTFFLCGDVIAWKKPTVRGSTCDTSVVTSGNLNLPNPADWNVCTLD